MAKPKTEEISTEPNGDLDRLNGFMSCHPRGELI